MADVWIFWAVVLVFVGLGVFVYGRLHWRWRSEQKAKRAAREEVRSLHRRAKLDE